LSDASYLNLQIVILFGEVTKAENIKANLQRRIKPTAGGAKKRLKKIEKIKFFFFFKKFFLQKSKPSQSSCIVLQLITVVGLNIFFII
jgi:hypothetical protein